MLRKTADLSRIAAMICVWLFVAPAFAETASPVSSVALQQALAAQDHVDLFSHNGQHGFNIDSSYFSGPASGVILPDSAANLTASDPNNDQSLYALLIDGRYDFNADAPVLSSSGLHPYVLGGMGMSLSSAHLGATSAFDGQSGAMSPLFRVGGGVTYRLDQKWNMSLDYKAGYAPALAGDQVVTGRGQQSVDLQALNLGMRYSF